MACQTLLAEYISRRRLPERHRRFRHSPTLSRKDRPMYIAMTRSINILVEPTYLDDQSEPEQDYYVWAYHVTIKNQGRETVRLRARYWKITDAAGHVHEVRGPGVVGEQPLLRPGETFASCSAITRWKPIAARPSRWTFPPSPSTARMQAGCCTEFSPNAAASRFRALFRFRMTPSRPSPSAPLPEAHIHARAAALHIPRDDRKARFFRYDEPSLQSRPDRLR